MVDVMCCSRSLKWHCAIGVGEEIMQGRGTNGGDAGGMRRGALGVVSHSEGRGE